MGLFGLFGKKPKPFPENGPVEAQWQWFQETSPWDEVSPKIIETIIKTFSNNPLIVAFVVRSMQHDLVGRYKAISDEDNPEPVIRSSIAVILYREAQPDFLEVMEEVSSPTPNIERVKEPLKKSLDCLETAVTFENINPLAHLCLAYICKILQRHEQFQNHIQQGLSALKQIEELPIPEELTGEVEIAELRQKFNELKDQGTSASSFRI